MEEINNKIVELFRKVISSLACINYTTNNAEFKNISNDFLKDLISQYDNFLEKNDVNIIEFNYSEKNIVDFCLECYSYVDIFLFAEDVEYGFSELVEKIYEGRKIKNGKKN